VLIHILDLGVQHFTLRLGCFGNFKKGLQYDVRLFPFNLF
jgi:hypothetical protein